MFKKLKNVGKKEVTLTEPNKSSLEPSNEKDPRDKLKKDKSSGGSKSGSIDGSKRDKKKDRDSKGESVHFYWVFCYWRVILVMLFAH